MTLAAEYERQERWRRWDDALARLPLHPGAAVLDLGCGLGQVAARLQRLGAEVVGIDANAELLAAARLRYPEVRFEQLDVAELSRFGRCPVDGLWASFLAAYFSDLESVLTSWRACLRPGGWLALVEVDDLLGHAPLPATWRERIMEFYRASHAGGGYDFESGRKLAPAMRAAGFEVISETTLPDDELSFAGKAPPDVVVAWRERVARMAGPRRFFGESYPELERLVLAAMSSAEHTTTARVVMVVGRRL